VTPAAVNALLGAPDVRAVIEQDQTEVGNLVLAVPKDAPSGLYFVRLRVLAGDAEVAPASAEGLELGTIHLGPVRVRGKDTFRDMPAIPVGRMGHLRLGAVRPAQDGNRLEIQLFWDADALMTRNYKASVRLLDASEKEIVADDKEPLYGNYPTTAWRPGGQVLDRRWLALPDDITPGDDYLIKVVVYDEQSGEVLGDGMVSGVAIERSDVAP